MGARVLARRAPAAGLALAAVAVCAGVVTSADASPRPAARSAALQRDVRALVAMPSGPPAVVAIVQRGGDRQVYSAGFADVKTRTAPGVDQRMRIASTAKAFSGAVALALVSRGTLSLSDRIGRWLPGMPAAWKRVTLAELLQHTSGVPDFSGSSAFKTYLVAHPFAQPSPRFLVGFVTGEPLGFTPGTRYRYSNTDNVLAGMIAERAARRPYEQLLASLVYRPLHLDRTSLPSSAAIARPYLHGYSLDPPQPPEDVSKLFSASYTWASGGIVSTPGDLNRFIRGYAGARLFSRAVQRAQLRLVAGHSEPPGPGANMAGMAIFRYRTRCGTVWGHTGNIAGYTQFMAATLDGRRSVTVSATEQITQNSTGPRLAAFKRLRALEADAVCAALS